MLNLDVPLAHLRRPFATAVLSAGLMLAILAFATIATEQPSSLATRLAHPHADDRVLVTFEPGASAARRTRSVQSVESASVEMISPRAPDTVLVRLRPGQTVRRAITALESRPGVAYAEPDYWLQAAATSNDPYFTDGSQWGMYGDASTPSNRFGSGAAEAWANGHTGDGSVYVGIIDQGLKVDHPDLAANVWTNPFETVDGVDNDGNGYVDDIHGWDFDSDDSSVYDGTADTHGTHVAGTVGARGGNGVGVAGVSWNVTLVSAKFLGVHGGLTSNAIRALDYMTDLRLRHGLEIVATNNSYSGPSYSQTLLDAIERAGDAGILFVAAAGNDGADLDATPRYPAAYDCDHTADGSPRGWDCIITVANIEPDGDLSPSSNHGRTKVHIGAPGSSIVSTVPQNDGYARDSGTSMAAPHVAGALALCHSADRTQSPGQLRRRLLDSGTSTDSLSGVTVTGARLDIGALLGLCEPGPTPTPAPTPTPSPEPTPTPTLPPTLTYVDDLEPGFSTYGSGWQESWSGWAGHHFHIPVQRYTRVRFASWKPVLPVAGSYVVQAHIPKEHATTRKAAYRIKTASGWVTRVRNQYYHRGSWMPLGTHSLTRTPIIQLADKTGEGTASGRRLAFDVVRLIPTPATREKIAALGLDATPPYPSTEPAGVDG